MKKQLNEPINHHYVPILHLKGFTNESGELQVYDKNIKSFISKVKTPRTIMYEVHRNTIKVKGVKTNEIEKMYGALENGFGKLFNMIRGDICNASVESVTFKELIKEYLAFQFWRLPINDGWVDDYIANLDLKKYGNRVTINDDNFGDNEEFKILLKTNKSFRYYFRCFYLPLLTFDIKTNNISNFKVSIIKVSDEKNELNNVLCTDFPIIIHKMESFFKYESSFIFPLSKNKVLIGHDKYVESMPPIFTTYLAMLSYGESLRYTTGENKDYIHEIIKLYDQMPDSSQQKNNTLRNKIFELLG